MGDEETRFIDKWWPLLLVLTYSVILALGLLINVEKTVAVDDCAQIIYNCYTLDKHEVLGTIDKYETVAAKPTLGNYRTFSYEVISWGNTSTDIEAFASSAAATMADARGWAQAGIAFSRIVDGGDFSLVLSEASILDTLPGCSSSWSCRSGRYVIINEDRWLGATTAWNNAGGSLRDYQHMVINHEVGHFLGLGHSYCSGAGNKAPIMQQQSIDLQGCVFNPWPLLSEINALQ